jgi:hypothetical protein
MKNRKRETGNRKRDNSRLQMTGFQFFISCFRFSILFVLLALTACGGGGGGAPLPEGPTTLAYAVSECRQEKGGEAFLTRQVLYVRQGDGEPRPVMEFGEVGPKLNNILCYGEFGLPRLGLGSTALWPLQRLGVSRDGSLVVFEVTDDFSLFSRSQVPTEQKGIYVVHADGSGLRRLGPASRAPCFTPTSFPCFFPFSPNGRTVTFTDLDSALPQLDAPQVFTLDVVTGEPYFQLTHLPAATPPTGYLASFTPEFLDAESITFRSYANPSTDGHPNGANPDGVATNFTVKTDGTGLEPVPVIVLPGGGIIPNFTITSAEPLATGIVVPGEKPVNGPGTFGDVVGEIFTFASNPSQVLQLTNFRRSDTYYAKLTADLQRVVFLASADPLGSNPAYHCEVFSIDRLGSDLRQLTNIGEGLPWNCDYFGLNPRTCSSTELLIDPVTGWVTFYSSCNPFGSNPYGSQIFTMRPDGTGLRQLTATRGMTRDADGTLTFELPGPWAVPARGY